MDQVGVAAEAMEAIVTHARASQPMECCGLLVGTAGRIERAVAAGNLSNSERAFLVDPARHFQTIRDARAEGRRVIGAYHSHPASPPDPSPRDVEGAEGFEDGFLSVIVSLENPAGPRISAYAWLGGNFRPLALVPFGQRV